MAESALLTVTDVHFGKKTSTYNVTACRHMFEKLGEQVAEHQGPKDELVVAIIGDVNDGQEIYENQPHHQDVTNVDAQAVDCAKMLARFLNKQSRAWKKVRVECVAGNHGRSGKSASEAANWDMVAYRYLAHELKGSKVQMRLPLPHEQFMHVIDVQGHGVLLYHGHTINMVSGFPISGISTRVLRWNATRAFRGFDTVLMGHFHTDASWPLNGIRCVVSGTPITNDEWALQQFGWESSNVWWMLGMTPDDNTAWKMPIKLARPDASYRRGVPRPAK